MKDTSLTIKSVVFEFLNNLKFTKSCNDLVTVQITMEFNKIIFICMELILLVIQEEKEEH